MVVVEFAYGDMKKLINIPREKMVDALSEMGAPSEYEPELDKIIAELTPNRPDWYSMEGLARSLRAYLKNECVEYKVKKSEYKVFVDPSVEKIRPYTVCAVIKGLTFDDQKIRDAVLLQEKLLATLGRKVKKFGLGIYPLSVIEFPVKYTAMKPEKINYVPLGHENEMNANDVLEKHKKGLQYGHLIKNFDKYPVFVDNKGKIMALIPIVNSAETGKIDENTEEIFVEVTGNDLGVCSSALNILACTFADMGGEVYEVGIEYKKEEIKTPDFTQKKMRIKAEEVNKILGVEFKEKEIAVLLKKMGYEYKNGFVFVPPYRADILGTVDIIEDIAIAYGYSNFKPTIPNFFSPGNYIKKNDIIDNTMTGMGFLEISTPILTNEEIMKKVGEKQDIIITNPTSQDYTTVRSGLVADMLKVFSTNKMKGLPQKLYEIGVVYQNETKKKLIFGIMDKKLDFSSFRGYLQTLAIEQGFEFELKKKEMELFENDVSCSVSSNGKNMGILGKVNEDLLKEFGIEFEVFLCELDLGGRPHTSTNQAH